MEKKIFWLFRLLKVISLFLIVAVIAIQLTTLQKESLTLRNQQIERFSQLLTNVIVPNASRHLSQNKTDALQQLIDDLRNDSMIRDATVYNDLGEIVAQSKDNIPLPELLNLIEKNQIEENEKNTTSDVRPYVEELRYDAKKVGYIRLSLEQHTLLNLINHYQERSFNRLIIMLLLALIAGMLIMVICYKRLSITYYAIRSSVQKINQLRNEK